MISFSSLYEHQIKHKAKEKYAVSLVIMYDYFNLLQGFVQVCMT